MSDLKTDAIVFCCNNLEDLHNEYWLIQDKAREQLSALVAAIETQRAEIVRLRQYTEGMDGEFTRLRMENERLRAEVAAAEERFYTIGYVTCEMDYAANIEGIGYHRTTYAEAKAEKEQGK